jgi:hypothetical protein
LCTALQHYYIVITIIHTRGQEAANIAEAVFKAWGLRVPLGQLWNTQSLQELKYNSQGDGKSKGSGERLKGKGGDHKRKFVKRKKMLDYRLTKPT